MLLLSLFWLAISTAHANSPREIVTIQDAVDCLKRSVERNFSYPEKPIWQLEPGFDPIQKTLSAKWTTLGSSLVSTALVSVGPNDDVIWEYELSGTTTAFTDSNGYCYASLPDGYFSILLRKPDRDGHYREFERSLGWIRGKKIQCAL